MIDFEWPPLTGAQHGLDEKACEICGDLFAPYRSTSRYCGNACRGEAQRRANQRVRDRDSGCPDAPPHRINCQAQPPKPCKGCGNMFAADHHRRLYCADCRRHGNRVARRCRRCDTTIPAGSRRRRYCDDCASDAERDQKRLHQRNYIRPVIECRRCGRSRPGRGRGLCDSCYVMVNTAGQLDNYPLL
ncbi:MAG: hypothetical protein F4Z29_07470 [Gemmatimonadetes bacterium]|nr:hypothetical protein [Gemmatimonadota bacterium]